MFRFIGSLLGFAKVLTQFFRERRLVALGEEKANAKAARKSISFDRRGLGLTAFGQLFWALCIDDKDSKPTTRK